MSVLAALSPNRLYLIQPDISTLLTMAPSPMTVVAVTLLTMAPLPMTSVVGLSPYCFWRLQHYIGNYLFSLQQ